MDRFHIRGLLRWWLLLVITYNCLCDVEWYLETERPHIAYYDHQYFDNITTKSIRYSRRDPLHYYHVYFHNIVPLDSNVNLHLYFYQLLTNVYKPSFVELHYTFCHFFQEDEVFGVFFRPMIKKNPDMNGLLKCPIVPGHYNFENVSFPSNRFVQQFPFEHGRIYVNVTRKQDTLVSGHVDVEKKMKRFSKNRGKKPSQIVSSLQKS